MIATKLKPSLFLRSVGTSIHCQHFKCFVSTAKKGLFSRKVSTIIFDGDPGVTDFKQLVEMVHAGRMSNATRLMLHNVIAEKINEAGERGGVLIEIVRNLYLDMRQRELIISSPAFEWEIWDDVSEGRFPTT